MPETDWGAYQSSNDYENKVINLVVEFTSTDSLTNSVAPAHLDMFSDHHPVEVNLAIKERISRRLHREYYSYCKCSFDSVITEMKANPFQPYCYSNIDVNTSLWYKWLFELIDRHTPKNEETPKLSTVDHPGNFSSS